MKIQLRLNILIDYFFKRLAKNNLSRVILINSLIILTVVFFLNIGLEAKTATYHTYSLSKFNKGKRNLDKAKKNYDTKIQIVKKDVHYLFWGPFYERQKKIGAIKRLKQKRIKYKLIKNGRYIFIGHFLNLNRVNKLKKSLDPLGLTSFILINKKKKMTKYTVIIKDNTIKNKNNNDDVIILSSPPPDEKSSESKIIPENNFNGNLLISNLYFHKTKDNLTQAFTQPTYKIPLSDFNWEMNLGASISLSSFKFKNLKTDIFELHETYLKFSHNNSTLSLGYQVLSWGRVFENSILDRFNRQNLHLGPQLDLTQTSLSQLALRAKHYFGASSLDLIYIPIFKPSSLPEEGEAWSPINKTTNRILGVPPSPIIEQLVDKGSYSKEDVNQGAYGVRLKTNFHSIETGVTLINSAPLIPYYKINQETVSYIRSGQTVDQAIAASKDDTFSKQYPNQNLYALDFSKEIGGTIYRLEVGQKNNHPVTTSDTFENKLMKSIEWNLSTESYPRNGKDTLNLMISGIKIQNNKEKVLDKTSIQYLAARYLIKFSQDTFKTVFKARIGLHETDIQIIPELTYLPNDRHSFTLGLGYFEGAEKSIGGFYNEHSYASIRWNYSF